jgi:hypothetical protein
MRTRNRRGAEGWTRITLFKTTRAAAMMRLSDPMGTACFARDRSSRW